MPVYPQAHAYDAVCEGADWVRNHEAQYVDVASVQVNFRNRLSAHVLVSQLLTTKRTLGKMCPGPACAVTHSQATIVKQCWKDPAHAWA